MCVCASVFTHLTGGRTVYMQALLRLAKVSALITVTQAVLP